MELAEFITDTLNGIREGVQATNSDDNKHYFMNSGYEIEFNIAVEVVNETEAGAKGGVNIKVVEIGGEGSTKASESNTSRIKFSVGIEKQIK